MKSTNFCEILSLLYGILIHETDNNSNSQINADDSSTITVHEKTFLIVINSMNLLNTIAILDLDTFQVRKRKVLIFFIWIIYFNFRLLSVKKQYHFNFDMLQIIFLLTVIIYRPQSVIICYVKLYH